MFKLIAIGIVIASVGLFAKGLHSVMNAQASAVASVLQAQEDAAWSEEVDRCGKRGLSARYCGAKSVIF